MELGGLGGAAEVVISTILLLVSLLDHPALELWTSWILGSLWATVGACSSETWAGLVLGHSGVKQT